MSSRLSRGRSTPAIRAIGATPSFGLPSTLPLLVPRVGADHDHTAVAPDDLALLADLLDARLYLHRSASLALPWNCRASGTSPVPEDDPAPGEVVRRQLDEHPVAGQHPDVVHPHLPPDVRQDPVPAG